MGRAFIQLGILFLHRAGSQVSLHADDGFYPDLLCRTEKIYYAEEGAVIGDGQGRHADLFRMFDQLGDIAESVKQGVLGMHMQVDKIGHYTYSVIANSKLMSDDRAEMRWVIIALGENLAYAWILKNLNILRLGRGTIF